jgi:LacI family transcriptional regulator
MASSRVTIQDVADKLGLSKFSVSRALSGKPGVGDATRSRVLRAAHAMGYRVNAEIAHSIGQILFVRQEIDMVSSEMWLNVLHGAEAEAERLGYSVVPRQARYLKTGRSIRRWWGCCWRCHDHPRSLNSRRGQDCRWRAPPTPSR